MSDDASTVLTSTQVDDRAPRGWCEVDGMLRTRLRTAGYTEAVELVTRIAAAADEADHHPDVDLRYNWVGLRLVSHDVGGLTERDIELAGEISRIADDLGAQATPEVAVSMTIGIDTADPDAIRPFWSALTEHRPAMGTPTSSRPRTGSCRRSGSSRASPARDATGCTSTCTCRTTRPSPGSRRRSPPVDGS